MDLDMSWRGVREELEKIGMIDSDRERAKRESQGISLYKLELD
jgi:hypothetical protein